MKLYETPAAEVWELRIEQPVMGDSQFSNQGTETMPNDPEDDF